MVWCGDVVAVVWYSVVVVWWWCGGDVVVGFLYKNTQKIDIYNKNQKLVNKPIIHPFKLII